MTHYHFIQKHLVDYFSDKLWQRWKSIRLNSSYLSCTFSFDGQSLCHKVNIALRVLCMKGSWPVSVAPCRWSLRQAVLRLREGQTIDLLNPPPAAAESPAAEHTQELDTGHWSWPTPCANENSEQQVVLLQVLSRGLINQNNMVIYSPNGKSSTLD